MMSAALSLTVLAAIALVGGAIWLWSRPGMRRKAVLMLVLAAIALGNVALWTVPDERGRTLAGQAAES